MVCPEKYIPGAHNRSHTQTLPSDRHTAGAGCLRLVPNVLYVQMIGPPLLRDSVQNLRYCVQDSALPPDISINQTSRESALARPRFCIGETRDHLERMNLVASSIGHIAIPRQLDSAIGVIF